MSQADLNELLDRTAGALFMTAHIAGLLNLEEWEVYLMRQQDPDRTMDQQCETLRKLVDILRERAEALNQWTNGHPIIPFGSWKEPVKH